MRRCRSVKTYRLNGASIKVKLISLLGLFDDTRALLVSSQVLLMLVFLLTKLPDAEFAIFKLLHGIACEAREWSRKALGTTRKPYSKSEFKVNLTTRPLMVTVYYSPKSAAS